MSRQRHLRALCRAKRKPLRKKVCGCSQGAGQEDAHAAKGKGTAEQKASRTRRTGRNPFLFGRLFLAACRKESRHAEKQQNYHTSVNQRQNLQDRRKKQAHISSVLREKGYVDRRYALPIFSRKAKERSSAGVKTAKRLSRSTKRFISFIVTGGSAMLLLLAVVIPLCAAAACHLAAVMTER